MTLKATSLRAIALAVLLGTAACAAPSQLSAKKEKTEVKEKAEKDATQPVEIASITKLITVYLVYEALET